MAEDSWYAIVSEADGCLLSTGTVIASVLPLGVVAIPIGGPPDADSVWNEARQQFIPRPEKKLADRLVDFIEQPGVTAVFQSFTPIQRQIMTDALIWLLGKRRYRAKEADPTF